MLREPTTSATGGKASAQDGPGCSHVRTHSHISTEPPLARPGHGPEGGSVLGTSVQPLFHPLAYCPAKLVDRYRRTGEQACRGWSLSAVKLKCLDCMGWEYTEAKRCDTTDCPLWMLNRRIFGAKESPASGKESS